MCMKKPLRRHWLTLAAIPLACSLSSCVTPSFLRGAPRFRWSDVTKEQKLAAATFKSSRRDARRQAWQALRPLFPITDHQTGRTTLVMSKEDILALLGKPDHAHPEAGTPDKLCWKWFFHSPVITDIDEYMRERGSVGCCIKKGYVVDVYWTPAHDKVLKNTGTNAPNSPH